MFFIHQTSIVLTATEIQDRSEGTVPIDFLHCSVVKLDRLSMVLVNTPSRLEGTDQEIEK